MQWIIEPQILVDAIDLANLALAQVEARHVQILCQPALVVTLGDDGHISLRRPAQQDLRRRFPVLVCDGLDGGVVEEERGVLGLLHVELEEGLRAKGRVRGDGDALVLRELDEAFLAEVRVVFDLQGGGLDGGVAQEIHDQLPVEVADPDALGQAFLREGFHGRPGLLDGGGAGDDVLAVVGEAGGVADRRVDVFERDGEVDDVQVEVVDAPVAELLLADGLDAVAVVERIPELGDEEEV